MKIEKRNIGTSVILSIVTCGIYGIIWGYKMAKEAVSVKDEKDDGLLEAILMIFLPFIGAYLAEKKFYEGCQAKGIAKEDRSIIYLILGLVGLGIVDFILLQSDLNTVADAVPAAAPTYTAPAQPAAPVYNAPVEAAPVEEAPARDDVVAALEQYKSLLDSGIITQEEFDAKKAELLSQI